MFENYRYAQQADSLKMRVNWIVGAMDARMKKGADKEGVQEYPGKVIQQLELAIGKLRAKQRA